MRSHNTELPPCTFEQPVFLTSQSADNTSFMRLMCSAEVYLEFFRGLPIQLRVRNDHGEFICMLPHRFQRAFAEVVTKIGDHSRSETEWTFFGRRHGNLEEVADLVISELDAAIDSKSLEQWQTQVMDDREITLTHLIFSLALLRASSQQVYLA